MKNVLKLCAVDAALLFCSKLSFIPVGLFNSLASKLGKFGFIFTALAKLFTILGKVLIIPFYVLTAVLILMLLLKLLKHFKKKKGRMKTLDLEEDAPKTTSEIARERNLRALKNMEANRMDIFKD